MPKSFEIEPPVTAEPNAPPIADLAKGSPPSPPPASAQDKAPPKKGKTPDTAGIDQFLKAQIGSDRYKEIVAKAPKEEDQPPAERGPDGKFVKATEKKPAPKKDESKTDKPPSKAVPFKPKPTPPAAPMTSEQIVAAAAEGAARALSSQKADKPAKDGEGSAPKPEEPKLLPEQQDRVEILGKMEQMYPEKYKGLSTKYRDSIVALERYAKEWETEHPGQEFDEESPEHEEFFTKNDVDWSDLDFQKAIARLVSEDVSKSTEEKTTQQLTELKRAEELRQKQGEIAAEQNTAAQSFWGELGSEFSDVLHPDGSLNMEKVAKLKETDDEGFQIQVTAAKALDLEVAEIYKLFNRLVDNDPANNPIHRNINQFAAAKEQALAAKPMQEKLNSEGKQFLPAAQYYKLPKAERDEYWTFSAKDLAFLRATDLAAITRKRVELNEQRHREWAKARGLPLEDPNAKPESPSSGGESRMAAVSDGTPKNNNEVRQNFLQVQMKGR